MGELAVYKTLIYDSRRWQGFEFRPGDIIITTPPKCGTTWTQMICALLIFDSPHFPAPLDAISPWLDMSTRSKADVHALLGAQSHRRFIKSHTPLDGLPMDPRVTHLVVGRDPRDVAISFEHHMDNLDIPRFLEARGAAVGNEDLADFPIPEPPSEDPVKRMQSFIEDPEGNTNLEGVLHHLECAWKSRHRPNVHLFHFSDYRRDLAGEMQRIAKVLDIPLTPARAEVLATEAGLSRMRERALEVVPDSTHNHWKDARRFFRTGGSGEWRERMDEAGLARYEARLAELSGDAEFLEWAHHGRGS